MFIRLLFVASALLLGADSSSGFVATSPRTKSHSQASSALNALYNKINAEETYNTPVRIEGNTMKTWKIDDDSQKYQVRLNTGGRPGNCEVNLWHGPDYAPTNIKIFLEDGSQYPLFLVLKPKGLGIDTIQVLNTGPVEMPITTMVGPTSPEVSGVFDDLTTQGEAQLVQGGGAVRSYQFDPTVERIKVAMVATEGRNVKMEIELLQGPNNIKQNVEFYASNAYKTPFYMIFETPNAGHQVRIRNKYSVEFPLAAYVEPMNMNTE